MLDFSGSNRNATKLIVASAAIVIGAVALTGWTISAFSTPQPDTPPPDTSQANSISKQDPLMAQRTKGDPDAPLVAVHSRFDGYAFHFLRHGPPLSSFFLDLALKNHSVNCSLMSRSFTGLLEEIKV